jgi:hypothetical protein
VAKEILFSCQHRSSEFSKRQAGLLVSCVTEGIVVHVEREWPLLQPGYGRHRTAREPIKQRADFPIVEDATLVALLMSREDVEGLHVALHN